MQKVIAGRFALDPAAFEVTVTSGIVTVTGQVERRAIACQLIDAVRHLEGVVDVRDRVSCPYKDRWRPQGTSGPARHDCPDPRDDRCRRATVSAGSRSAAARGPKASCRFPAWGGRRPSLTRRATRSCCSRRARAPLARDRSTIGPRSGFRSRPGAPGRPHTQPLHAVAGEAGQAPRAVLNGIGATGSASEPISVKGAA